MVLYEEIVRAKFAAGPAHQLELEQVERGRKYGERILGLESDIREVEGRLQQLDRMLAGLATKYHPQVSSTSSSVRVRVRSDSGSDQFTELDLALRKYKEDLARVLADTVHRRFPGVARRVPPPAPPSPVISFSKAFLSSTVMATSVNSSLLLSRK